MQRASTNSHPTNTPRSSWRTCPPSPTTSNAAPSCPLAFPDDEHDELELIYRAKGLDGDAARTMADAIMADPDVALDTLAREELGLNPGDLGSPCTAAVSSFFAFAVGALVPLLPFVFATGTVGLVTSAAVSAVALATVGATISVFTGRPAWRSALRMVLIGGGAAGATYLIGSVVGVTLD